MKGNKGITLVSLVVTIIVLILLAGISINLLLGENGIITKAKEAKRMQEIAEIKEKLSLEVSAAETDAILRNENLEKTQLEDIINKYGTLQEDGDTIITKEKQYEISLKEIWYGVLSESGSYSAKVEQIEILEKELTELQEKYNELEEINSGNSEILEELRTRITELENEKSALEESLNNAQEKIVELENIKQLLGQTNVTEDKILKDYKAYSNGELLTGTMTNNGALNATLNAGASYTIPAGYTTGGKVTANSLASQTQATATAGNITAGKTAYVNGQLITGTGADNNSHYNAGITDGSNMTSMKRKLIAANVNNQGTYTSCSDGTKLSDLGNLDINNFACIPKNVSGSGMVSSTGWYTATSSINPSLSYNNGTLSVSGLSVTSYDGTRQWNSSTVTVDIYVYYCN